MLKKIITTCLILILIVLFAATYFLGQRTERTFIRQLTVFNRQLGTLSRIELQNYSRQFFSARAQTLVVTNGDRLLTMSHQIRHFLWGVQIRTTIAPVEGKSLPATEPTLESLPLVTVIHPDGTIRSELAIPTLYHQSDNGILNLHELRLVVTGQAASSELETDLSIKGLTLKNNNKNGIILENIRSVIRQTPPSGLFSEMTVAKALLDRPGGATPAALEELSYRGSSMISGSRFSAAADLTFKGLHLEKEEFGTGALSVTLNGIDKNVVETFRQLLSLRTARGEISQADLADLYFQLLRSGFNLQLKTLQLSHEDGNLAGTGHWTLAGSELDMSPFAVINNSDLALKLQIAKNLFDKLANQTTPAADRGADPAANLLDRGLLTEDAGIYRFDFRFEEGQAYVNGRPYDRF